MDARFEQLQRTTLATFATLVEQDTSANFLPNLLVAVQQVTVFVTGLALAMLQAYADIRYRQVKSKRRICPKCGKPMEWNGDTSWNHGTQFGDVRVRDPYCYCRGCHEAARPVHGLLGTSRQRWSLELEHKVVDLVVDESCGKAVEKLERQHPGTQMDRTAALRMLHKYGGLAREFVTDKFSTAIEQRNEQQHSATELEVEYDAGMVPVATLEKIPVPVGESPERTPVRNLVKRRKNCHWQEAKLGLVQVPGDGEQDNKRLYTARPTHELQSCFEDLLALAYINGLSPQTQVRGIADGARYIRSRMSDTFGQYEFVFILDRPHAKEHLDDVGSILETLGGKAKEQWAKEALQKLETGEATTVVNEIRCIAKTLPVVSKPDTDKVCNGHKGTGPTSSAQVNGTEGGAQVLHPSQSARKPPSPKLPRNKSQMREDLEREANYFERNQDSVVYEVFRERGWSTASSEIESAHRSVIQLRVKIPGAWWHPDNIKNIIALRIIKVNGWWTEFWDLQRKRWNERAQEFRSTQTRTKLAA